MTSPSFLGDARPSFCVFNSAYKALTGHECAYRWQYRLFSDLAAGRFPKDIILPTGIGKTSIIALWVLALSRALAQSSNQVPRRLAYVVDRRVVVDQASEFAEKVHKNLHDATSDQSHVLHKIATTLKEAGCTSSVIEVSTLRGERALDTQWRDDPTRPAIIVGTVDMIGSRLLFSAYGRVGPWGRALEAGLLGQDCLIVLDEAHLCTPFAATLEAIERQNRQEKRLAPFAVIRMGATMEPVVDMLKRTPGLPQEQESIFKLLEKDTSINGSYWSKETDENDVRNRLEARKRIEVEELKADSGVGAHLADWAFKKSQADTGAVIGIVLNTVAEARKCVAKLLKHHHVPGEQIVTLTGSMRGWDRDEVVKSDKYERLKSQRDRKVVHDKSIFLVATSCVEVGADIDCDHLGVEACAADSLIQRLGRVNRLGKRKDVTVMLVGDENATGPAGKVFKHVQELVANGKELQGSPATFLGRLKDGLNEKEWRALFDVRVPPPALTSAVLDDLAMTSKYPNSGARPDVSRWLHGSVEDSSLYVELAWRAELDRVTDPDDATRLIAAFPVGARETARCPFSEAVELLEAIHDRAKKDQALGTRVLLIIRYGETTALPLRELPADDSKLQAAVYNATVVLPTSAGGYDGQFVDPASTKPVKDIAEEAQPKSRAQRRRLWVDSGKVTATVANGDKPQGIEQEIKPDTDAEDLLSEVKNVAHELLGKGWQLVDAAGTRTRGVVVAREDRRALEEAEDDDGSLGFQNEVLLTQHHEHARSKATELCQRLSLPERLRDTVIEAAGQHDLGKNRPWWQRAVGRIEKPAVAKSRHSHFDHKINQGYRHELGSVADLGDGKASLPTTVDRELCLHLVAAHHGHARPGFRDEAAGPVVTDEAKRVLSETPVRFAKLQVQYGWWALAWLEALVKAADVLASRDEENSP